MTTQETRRLTAGDITPHSPTTGKDQELAKWSILKAVSMSMPVGEVLGAMSGVILWALHHLPSETDQTAALEGFITALRIAVSGKFNVPLSDIAKVEIQRPS